MWSITTQDSRKNTRRGAGQPQTGDPRAAASSQTRLLRLLDKYPHVKQEFVATLSRVK